MVSQCEYRGHRRFPPLTGQLFIVIFPEPVMSWTASTPSDGSPKGSLWYAENCNAANRPV